MTATLTPVIVTIPEYGTVTVACGPPSPEDRAVAADLAAAGDDAKLRVRWLIDGRAEISASSWVGVVRFSDLDIRIVPKLVGGDLNVLRMIAFASGVDVLRRLPNLRALPQSGVDFLQLVCVLLAEESEWVLRHGLLRDYRIVEEPVSVLRGRLKVRDQYLRRFGRPDVLECRFDQYDGDIPENQLLAAALSVGRHVAEGHELSLRMSRLAAIWNEVCSPPSLDPDSYTDYIRYGRRNRHYEVAHTLAALVLHHLGFRNVFDSRPGRVKTFLVDMNRLFERFIKRLLAEALQGTPLQLSALNSLSAVIRDDSTGGTYARVRPDLVITRSVDNRRVPIDVKYKRYEVKKVLTSDVYQTFLYAYALGDVGRRRAGILHPAADDRTVASLSVHSTAGVIGARISVIGVDVPRVLDGLGGTPSDRGAVLRAIAARIGSVCGCETDLPAPHHGHGQV